ncbi:hypothetical protein AUJ42_03595 [Candidatus Collierbacteria bacterium CG1_02_44_10]|uniref:Uncharacterized protein n=1 Tax=Candidatus Collierbacteria bacterium CG1_02_44_10 TaxID=1805087 RepID=A0A1J4RT19_9BACT|nr:MAG: hypothetical protein AUJ42_03595 [Candidatus Collierbacteria bacterium CG1_02_44_10]
MTEVDELKYWVTEIYQILEVNKGYRPEPGSKWLVDSESLLQKIGMQTLSILHLLEGTKPILPKIPASINFIDHYTIQNDTRSILESYLVLYHVFIDQNVNIQVKKMRHRLWHASSLSQRQKQSKFTINIKTLLKQEKSSYLKMRRAIIKSKVYKNSIKISDPKNLTNKKSFDWKPPGGWRAIASMSSISETFWVDVYNDLSATSHSGAVISNHMSHADQKKVQKGMSTTAVNLLNLILPHFIEGYASLFPRVGKYLESDEKLKFNIKVAKGVLSGY